MRLLPELQPRGPVLINCEEEKGWKQHATVRGMCAPRSYVVYIAGGSFRLNRKHLRLQAGTATVYDPVPKPDAAPDPVPDPAPDSPPHASTGSTMTATTVQSVPDPGFIRGKYSLLHPWMLTSIHYFIRGC